VTPIARRRRFSGAEKRRILGEADLCTKPGQLGALLRREAGPGDEEHDAATEDRGAHQQQNDVNGHSLVHLFIRL